MVLNNGWPEVARRQPWFNFIFDDNHILLHRRKVQRDLHTHFLHLHHHKQSVVERDNHNILTFIGMDHNQLKQLSRKTLQSLAKVSLCPICLPLQAVAEY